MFTESYVVLLFKLWAGVKTIESPHLPVDTAKGLLYARAAAYHAYRAHVDPYELIAIARNESDFSEKAVGPDGLDCGLTQTRVTYSRYNCAQLQRSPWIAFQEAAREMSSYARSCIGKEDYDRCRINRYNSGHRYAQRGHTGRYWLRVSCFAEAARQQLPLASRCREVRSEQHLALMIDRAVQRREDLRNLDNLAFYQCTPARGISGARCAGAGEPAWLEQQGPLHVIAVDPLQLERGLPAQEPRAARRARRRRRPGGPRRR